MGLTEGFRCTGCLLNTVLHVDVRLNGMKMNHDELVRHLNSIRIQGPTFQIGLQVSGVAEALAFGLQSVLAVDCGSWWGVGTRMSKFFLLIG